MKKKIFFAFIVIVILGISFFMGDNIQNNQTEIIDNNHPTIEDVAEISNEEVQDEFIEVINEERSNKIEQNPIENSQAEPHQNTLTSSIGTSNDIKTSESTIIEPQSNSFTLVEENENPSSNSNIQDVDIQNEQTVSLAVNCKTILNHLDQLSPNIIGLIPQNGIILPSTKVPFNSGDSAFDVLKREMIARKIHLEFNYTPVYNSVYIEGINNIYEFDCGNLSGWMYRVNGITPNYASSEYMLSPDDNIEFIYTCDLGNDI